jgi:hypothetical protein
MPANASAMQRAGYIRTNSALRFAFALPGKNGVTPSTLVRDRLLATSQRDSIRMPATLSKKTCLLLKLSKKNIALHNTQVFAALQTRDLTHRSGNKWYNSQGPADAGTVMPS